MFDVIIAGCGPTGAMLAAELRLHDVRVLVLEKETEPASFVRIVGLHIRSLELMAMRGLLERMLERGRQRPVGGIFAAIPKPAPEGLDSAHAYLLGIPQPVINHLLEDHAIELGAQVRHGCAVAGFEQDDEGVTVELADGEQLRSRYLVGCDGARSTVRKRLGVGFPGEPSRNDTLMGEMEVGMPQEEIAATLALAPRDRYAILAQALRRRGLQRPRPRRGRQRPCATAHPRGLQAPVAHHRRNRLRRALPALDVPLRGCHPTGRALPHGAGAPRRRRGAHPPTRRRSRPQPRRPGRVQPRLETRRPDPRLGAGDPAGHLPRRTSSRSPRTCWTTPAPRSNCRPPARAHKPCAGCSPN